MQLRIKIAAFQYILFVCPFLGLVCLLLFKWFDIKTSSTPSLSQQSKNDQGLEWLFKFHAIENESERRHKESDIQRKDETKEREMNNE